jgi:hypothetical protein
MVRFSGYSSARPRAIVFNSALACASVTPGFIRATTLRIRTGRIRGMEPSGIVEKGM